MTEPTVWRVVIELVDEGGRHPVVIGTYATSREAWAIAHAVPMAVEVIA
jgi:hypothetical protein